MAVTRTTASFVLHRLALPAFQTAVLADSKLIPSRLISHALAFPGSRRFSYSSIRCEAGKKASSRLSQIHQVLFESEERAKSAANEPPPPTISLEHVSVSFARSGGPGGQNVNKVNTKVDMRFNVKDATWLSERIRDKILLSEKNRINKDGEIVISSTKTRTQQGNIQDCLSKLQAIIDAAAYVPPPPSEEQKKKISQFFCFFMDEGLPNQSRNDYRTRKSFHKRNNSEEAKIVGTEPTNTNHEVSTANMGLLYRIIG